MRGLSVLKGRRRGAGALWLLCFGLPLSAPAIPLDQAVRAGLAIHPQVRSAMAEADRAGTEVEIAKGGYYPSVTMSGGPQEFDVGEVVYDVTVSQMLYDWGRVTSKVDSASATRRKLSEAVLVARDDAALDIVETYLDVLASERRVETVRQHIQRLDGIREMTQLIQINRAFESVSSLMRDSESSLDEAIKTLGGSR